MGLLAVGYLQARESVAKPRVDLEKVLFGTTATQSETDQRMEIFACW